MAISSTFYEFILFYFYYGGIDIDFLVFNFSFIMFPLVFFYLWMLEWSINVVCSSLPVKLSKILFELIVIIFGSLDLFSSLVSSYDELSILIIYTFFLLFLRMDNEFFKILIMLSSWLSLDLPFSNSLFILRCFSVNGYKQNIFTRNISTF